MTIDKDLMNKKASIALEKFGEGLNDYENFNITIKGKTITYFNKAAKEIYDQFDIDLKRAISLSKEENASQESYDFSRKYNPLETDRKENMITKEIMGTIDDNYKRPKAGIPYFILSNLIYFGVYKRMPMEEEGSNWYIDLNMIDDKSDEFPVNFTKCLKVNYNSYLKEFNVKGVNVLNNKICFPFDGAYKEFN